MRRGTGSAVVVGCVVLALWGCGGESDRREGTSGGAGTSGGGGDVARAGGSASGGLGNSAGASGRGGGGTSGSEGVGKGGAAGIEGKSGSAGVPPMLPTPCVGEEERVEGSGYWRCDNGLVHRPSAGVCAPYQPSEVVVPPSPVPDADECHLDAECVAKPYGRCLAGGHPYGGTPFPTACNYGCTVDADCLQGTICVCTEGRGTCKASDCVVDADCGTGRYCAEFSARCGGLGGFACQSTEDECQLASDCAPSFVCGLSAGTRVCDLLQCPS